MSKTPRIKKSRVWEIDFFRGISILLVVWDHAMVDLTIFHSAWKATGVEWLMNWGLFGYDYLNSDVRFFWRPVFLFIFFFASGLSTAFSKNNLVRGLRLAAVSVVVSVVTYLLSSWTGGDYFVLFGVLHCIAAIILIYTLLVMLIDGVNRLISLLATKQYSQKLSKIITAFVCLALSVVFYWVHKKYNVSLYETDYQNLYVNTEKEWLGLFFYVRSWATADYFPLFPFISYFFLGAGLTQFLYPQRKSLMPSIDGKWNKVFTTAGKYSLFIYLAIQVVMFALFALITYIAAGVFLI